MKLKLNYNVLLFLALLILINFNIVLNYKINAHSSHFQHVKSKDNKQKKFKKLKNNPGLIFLIFFKLKIAKKSNLKSKTPLISQQSLQNEDILNHEEETTIDNNFVGSLDDVKIDTIKKLIDKFQNWKHHNYAEMSWFLNYYNTSCFNMSYLYSIGTSVQNRELWVMAFGENPDKHIPGVPEVKLIGNIHGNEISGKELLLYLIKHICENIKTDPEFTFLLKNLRLHILPSLNPDGMYFYIKL